MTHYVIDTSVAFEAFIGKELREDILLSNVNLIAPAELEIELFNKRAVIQSIANLSKNRFDIDWRKLRQKISIRNVGRSKVNQAERILRDIKNLNLRVGLEDKPFFALALYL